MSRQADTDRYARIAAWYKDNSRRTVVQAARQFKCSYETVVSALDRTKTKRNPVVSKTAERDAKIAEKRAAGQTLAAIGGQYRLTRQRVHQILGR